MSKRISFEALLAKREQREADKLKVGMLDIPGSDAGLEARMPPQKAVLEIYGELSAASGALEALQCGKHALYAVCPQLQDRKLQAELGVAEDPMGILDALFSVAERRCSLWACCRRSCRARMRKSSRMIRRWRR